MSRLYKDRFWIENLLLSVGINLLLVIPSILVANTPLWTAYNNTTIASAVAGG